MQKVLVLGASGMLGAMVADFLSLQHGMEVTATARTEALVRRCAERLPSCQWVQFDADDDNIADILQNRPCDWIINAIGIIKPFINEADAASTARAVRINALFPHRLAEAAAAQGCKVLQIATDCVYSGRDGRYREGTIHDALDVYGKTKSLGEVPAESIHHLRCSIIGPEPKGHVSLLDWFRGQPQGASVTGFTNHSWNGVTTLHFAKICHGVIMNKPVLPRKLHVVPSGTISKADMLKCFAAAYGRDDMEIKLGEATTVIDRTLETDETQLNQTLWHAAGYLEPPTVPQMINEMAAFPFRMQLDEA